MTSVKKSRATLIGVALAFLIPVIGAKLVLDQDWYKGAVTNKGTMLVPPIELAELSRVLPEGWRVAFIDNGQCEVKCMQGAYAINQLDIALGRESERVTPIVLSSVPSQLALENTPVVTAIVAPQVVEALGQLPSEQLFIIDPLGNVMLHYPLHAEEEKMRLEAKDMMSDLKTLLKLSKIG